MESHSSSSSIIERGLRALGLVCLGLLILQVSISFLPDIVLLRYITTTRLILLIGFVPLASLYVMKKRSIKEDISQEGLKTLLALVTLMLFWFAISALINASSISLSLVRLQIEEVFAFLLAIMVIRNEDQLRAVLFVFLVAVSVMTFHSMKQFIGHENTNFFLTYNHNGTWKAVEMLQAPKGAVARVSGYFNNPNVLATYLAMLLPITALSIRRPSSSNLIVGVLLSISAIALLFTFSRGAVIALLLAIAIVLFRKTRVLAYSIVPIVIVVLVNPFSLSRLTSGLVRFKAWSLALTMISQKPLFGVGLGNFRSFAQGAHVNLWHAHNIFLNTAAEAGIVSGILLLAIFAMTITWALQLSNQEGPGKPIGISLFISLAALTITSLIDDTYNIKPISYTFWIILGLLVASRHILREPSKQELNGDDEKRIIEIR